MDKDAKPPVQKQDKPEPKRTEPVFIKGTATPEIKK